MMATGRIIQIDTVTEHLDAECDDCGYNALIRLRGYHLGPAGVHTIFDEQFCGRCRAEERRQRHERQADA